MSANLFICSANLANLHPKETFSTIQSMATSHGQLQRNYLIKSLKKEGYVLVGLYNRLGRLRTIIRRYIFKIFGRKILEKIDPTLRNLKLDENEKIAWIRDQYIHPIESLHTIDEVLTWFKKNDIENTSDIIFSKFDNSC